MSDDKIKISWDELGHSDSTKSQQPSYAPPPNYTQETQPPHSYPDTAAASQSADKTGWLIGGIIAAVLVIGLLAFCLLRVNSAEGSGGNIIAPHRQTVEEFRQEVITSLNAELAKSDCPAWKRIEEAHGTVTVYSAKVKSITVDTLDGSNYADEGRNVSTVTMELEFHWDGIIHRGGTTILEIVYDEQADKLLRAEITYSDAMINIEDPNFWYNVGLVLGTAMAL